MAENILVSTDIGSDIDDALSLLVMLNHPAIDVRGIYTVNGDVRSRSYIAKRMVDLAGKKIDVAAGEPDPIEGGIPPYSFFEDCYIDDIFIDEEKTEEESDIVFKHLSAVGIKTNGVKDMARKLYRNNHAVFSLAPLTNIARLMEIYPEAVKNITRLYVMGCRFPEEGELEHNIRYDAPAARRVLDSDIPVTIIPGDLCSRYQMPTARLERLNTPAGRYVQRMARGSLGIKTAQVFTQENLERLIREYAHANPESKEEDLITMRKLGRKLLRMEKLTVNLNDPYHAALDPEGYFRQYRKLIAHLRDPELNYAKGDWLARIMEMIIPTTLSIPDVFVPYCFLHQNRLQTERKTVSCDSDGRTLTLPGTKHEIVRDLDWEHFQSFIKEWIR